ncbi:MAG: hypothetical protein KIT35_22050 [Piscinibacter sp.]|uniref:hypothetical protein n=1 Tax=Piscinibacter sp. TaxID=1903157 RepID=UPI00258E97B3|nr:hypothetical protein [Piscinibacter sp.]MCW5666524.1 hypothetical protein [Piscinibacter sp.]
MIDFGQLDYMESRVLRFGFDRDLQAGETMTDITLEIEVERGTDAQPELLKQGSVLVDGQDVLQLVQGRVANVKYHFRCRCKGATTGLWHVVPGYLYVKRG